MDDALQSRLLDMLYRGVADAAALKQALELLAKSFSCQSAAFVAFDFHEPGASFLSTTGLFADEAVLKRHFEYAAVDPAPGMFASLAAGCASTTDRLLSPEIRKTSQFANEFYYPLGLVETLGSNLFLERGRSALIGLHRGNERGEFTDTDLAEIDKLSPHLRRVLQLRRAFVRLEDKSTDLETALDGLPSGLALLDEDGAAVFVNRTMQAIAQRGDGFTLNAAGCPTPRLMETRRRFQRLLNDVMQGGAGGALSLPSSRGGRAYAALISRVPGALADGSSTPSRRAAALVIVHDPASRFSNRAVILRETLGLPEGASQLALALAGDDDLKSFAERQGITIHTARFHLRIALARTGTRTQAELVKLVVRLLRDLALDGSSNPGP